MTCASTPRLTSASSRVIASLRWASPHNCANSSRRLPLRENGTPMKIVSAAEMREIDRVTSERFGVPSLTLMENAGSAVAEFVLRSHSGDQKILVVCGKGNNGGDGLVAARLLHDRSKPVQVILLADPSELKGDAAVMYGRLPMAAVIVRSREELKSERGRALLSADIVVDAILGTGFKPPVTGLYADAISAINASKAHVIAVDIPSGADADAMGSQQGTIARTDLIVTFTAPRPAHVFSMLGEGPTYVADIGSPDEAIVSSLHLNLIHAREFAPLIGPRPADSNKGLYGHVLVVGGSVGKAGSVAMAGMAALRAGAGLSTVATAKSALPTVAGFHPELMTEPLPETGDGTIGLRALESGLRELFDRKTVIAIGPGISRHADTSVFVRSVVRALVPENVGDRQAGTDEAAIVADADALNAF